MEIDVQAKGLKSAYAVGPFDKGLTKLKSKGYKPISISVNAQLRILEGKEAKISIYGNWTREGAEYLSGKLALLRMNSRLLNPKLAKEAVQVNSKGKYFALGKKVYAEDYEQAQKDLSKEPEKRSVLVLPSRDTFSITPKDDIARALFSGENNAVRYFDFASRDKINFYLIDKATVDARDQTLLTQVWFSYLVNESDLNGNYSFLSFDYYRLRGIRKCAEGTKETGKASSQKIRAPTLTEILSLAKPHVHSVAKPDFEK